MTEAARMWDQLITHQETLKKEGAVETFGPPTKREQFWTRVDEWKRRIRNAWKALKDEL